MGGRELLELALAEGQARETKLRAYLSDHECWQEKVMDGPCPACELLATPQDDSALHEMIEAAKAEEREACAQEAERQAQDEPYGHAKFRCTNIAAEIRARKRAQ